MSRRDEESVRTSLTIGAAVQGGRARCSLTSDVTQRRYRSITTTRRKLDADGPVVVNRSVARHPTDVASAGWGTGYFPAAQEAAAPPDHTVETLRSAKPDALLTGNDVVDGIDLAEISQLR